MERTLLLPGLLLALFARGGWAQDALSPLEKYRALKFPAKFENFDKGWEDRVALEFEIINGADLRSLRAALKDEDVFVRSMAARALGILGDKASAEGLAELAKADPEVAVRIRAVESLGLLKLKSDVVEAAKKDGDLAVRWTAERVAGQFKKETDFASLAREAYAAGIPREAMGSAKVGRPAPDFSARKTDGTLFKLSEVLGKKAIAIYFAAFDG